MKQLLFALFIVLAYSTATGGTERNASTKTALREAIDVVEDLQDIGKETWDSLSTSIKRQQHMCTLRYIKKGLRDMKKKCHLIKEKEKCTGDIDIIKENLKSLKMEGCRQQTCENKSFTDFLKYLTSFLQQNIKS